MNIFFCIALVLEKQPEFSKNNEIFFFYVTNLE